ncbi:uncharacterized protein H6S33_011310 [Morchella sextelata]|uniref:uncharacterized protein n=1 Tax=Morchella sextelata TaxID=1174677 RepID=UPI001D03AB65|nr:uncharacterized protein H6S33_011310 [Morchella sextelata]KAH0610883.1 hypothetical protein H6S33_011310 [Morchella sextelata]
MCHCMVAKLLWYVFAVHAWELTRTALFLSLQRGFLSTLSASLPDVSEIVLRNCDTHAPRDRRQDGKQPHGLSLGSMTGSEARMAVLYSLVFSELLRCFFSQDIDLTDSPYYLHKYAGPKTPTKPAIASAPTTSIAPPNLDSDFYNPHLSVSLNPHTHLFTYNFGNPPCLRNPPRPRRGLEPVPMVPRRLLATDDAGLNPLHRRPRLFVQRMAAVQLREMYNPYLKYREDTQMAEVEWGRAEVERYMQVLKERGGRRREEEREDGRRVKALVGAVRARAEKGVGGGGQGSSSGLNEFVCSSNSSAPERLRDSSNKEFQIYSSIKC